jgi:hypothetical protein
MKTQADRKGHADCVSRVRTALTMYAVGFRGSEHLARIRQEAQAILARAFAAGAKG